jgi:hypothetical protein
LFIAISLRGIGVVEYWHMEKQGTKTASLSRVFVRSFMQR